jgi:hypothetical protein
LIIVKESYKKGQIFCRTSSYKYGRMEYFKFFSYFTFYGKFKKSIFLKSNLREKEK